jgi:N-sulfoglucosamine sulfohydrolase
MISRRAFTQAFAAAPALAQPQRRNILLMIADDLGLHTGAYSDSTAKTPNLDRLAEEGVRFTHAFCTTASCSASRSVILSGLQNHNNGHYGHAHSIHNFSYLPKVRPLPDLLKDAGYATGVIGKLHVNPLERFRWDLVDDGGGGRNGSVMAATAKRFIQSANGKPWYLHIGFTDPHRAARGFANRDYPGIVRTPFDPQKVDVPSFLPDNTATRQEVAEYYEAANRLDQGVGHFLNMLKETGQLDNTLIVFISDNGMPFTNAKTNLYDAGVHLPMIVRHPGQSRRGIVNTAMTTWADLTPTFLEWAGAKGPEYPFDGRSWLPVLEQENPTGWDEVYFSHTFHEVTMHYPIRGMRTRQYKYLRNLTHKTEFPFASDLFASKTWQSLRPEGMNARLGRRPVKDYLHRAEEELYDITKDADELTNLALTPEYKQKLAEMRNKVQDFRKRSNDPWLILSRYSGEDETFQPPV